MSTLLLEASTVLAGPSLDPTHSAPVAIVEGRIVDPDELPTGEPLERVDLGGLTLLPGFIDAHVHIGFYSPAEVLRGGVTTVRDLGWPPGQIHSLATASLSADFDGPRIVAVGPMLTVAGGYPTRAAWAPPSTARVVTGPDDARVAVRERVEEGATCVKVALNASVGPTLDLETLSAICDEAHAHGLNVTGHVDGLDELVKALDAGMDELAHMLMSREAIPDRVIARMVEQDMTVVPTLSIFGVRGRRRALMNLDAFLSAGGRVVYGTDLGNQGPKPGIDRREIDRMTRAGMEPKAIISSGTVESARWLGLDGKGVIAPGMDADIIGVEGDPLDAAVQLNYVRFVMRAGRIFLRPR